MKYKLTLLKDLPNRKAGTEVLNISQEEMDGTVDYKYRYYVPEQNFSDIYDLRNNPEWVKVEVDNRCDCKTMDYIEIRHVIIDYGRIMDVKLDFKKKAITTWYDSACDYGSSKNLDIQYCPLCGRKL